MPKINVHSAFSSGTIEVAIMTWDQYEEYGTGIVADGSEVTVFTSYDGDGYLVLSDQDSERLEREGKL